MYVQLRHKESGQVYTLPVTQVVTYTADGYPVAVAYDRASLIVTADLSQEGFEDLLSSLKIGKLVING